MPCPYILPMDINAAMTTATAGMITSLGRTMTYTPAGGSAVELTVLFDNEYQEIDLVSGTVSSAAPAAHCRSGDVAGAAKGDALAETDGSVSYTVTAVKPDGTGMTTLLLKKA